jgi:hypothetical protein
MHSCKNATHINGLGLNPWEALQTVRGLMNEDIALFDDETVVPFVGSCVRVYSEYASSGTICIGMQIHTSIIH